ncbi:MAG TPA: hypothetical protein VNO17_04930 [Actinomycetota bacterium]|nr:hypothetical protein [Actinomycetota bacterium]
MRRALLILGLGAAGVLFALAITLGALALAGQDLEDPVRVLEVPGRRDAITSVEERSPEAPPTATRTPGEDRSGPGSGGAERSDGGSSHGDDDGSSGSDPDDDRSGGDDGPDDGGDDHGDDGPEREAEDD